MELNKEEVRQIRWSQNEKWINQVREQMGNDIWLLSLPSPMPNGRHFIVLPLDYNPDSFYSELDMWREHFTKLATENDVDEPRKMLAAVQSVMNDEYDKCERYIKVAIGWYLVYFFEKSNNGRDLEIFEDQKLVSIDFNMIEVSSSHSKKP